MSVSSAIRFCAVFITPVALTYSEIESVFFFFLFPKVLTRVVDPKTYKQTLVKSRPQKHILELNYLPPLFPWRY